MVETNSSTSGIVATQQVESSVDFTSYTELPCRGFNRIFKAKRNGKWHILKGLKEEFAKQALYKELLNKEFDITFSLDHPNVVRVFNKEQDKLLGDCIVMEYVDGITLREFLKTRVSESIKQKIVLELLDAMAYFHSKQIIHRDLKPDNILITHNGNNVKIIDFGLSDTDYHDVLKQAAGTRQYAAPEQLINNAPIDARTDIYAFGKLLQELDIKQCKRIVKKCTQADCNKRFSNVGEVLNAFQNRKKIAWIYVVLALCIMGLVIALFWANRRLVSTGNISNKENKLKSNVQATKEDAKLVGNGDKTKIISSHQKDSVKGNASNENLKQTGIATSSSYGSNITASEAYALAKPKIDSCYKVYKKKAESARIERESYAITSGFQNDAGRIILKIRVDNEMRYAVYSEFESKSWEYTYPLMDKLKKIGENKPYSLTEEEQDALPKEQWEITLFNKFKHFADSVFKATVKKKKDWGSFSSDAYHEQKRLEKEIPIRRNALTISRWERMAQNYSNSLIEKLKQLERDELMKEASE